jgi:hypothetical protein
MAVKAGSIGMLPLACLIVVISGIGALPLASDVHCSASCDELGRCMPLRHIWGVQKGGSTSMFDMLQKHGACGTTTRFSGSGSHEAPGTKESHYITDTVGPPDRQVYTSTYPKDNCKSLCHVDVTLTHPPPALLSALKLCVGR